MSQAPQTIFLFDNKNQLGFFDRKEWYAAVGVGLGVGVADSLWFSESFKGLFC